MSTANLLKSRDAKLQGLKVRRRDVILPKTASCHIRDVVRQLLMSGCRLLYSDIAAIARGPYELTVYHDNKHLFFDDFTDHFSALSAKHGKKPPAS
jgi:hypothetical protein